MGTHPGLSGRGWAYLGASLGGVVSTAANVAHSYVPPPKAPTGWSPEPGAVIGAVFWPVALFVAIEILARTPWPDGRRWAVLRWCGLLPVAMVAAVVSYLHLSGLLRFYGEDWLTVRIGPLAVDGLMLMASGAIIATGKARTVAEAPRTHPQTHPETHEEHASDPDAHSIPDARLDTPATASETQPERVSGTQGETHPPSGSQTQSRTRGRTPSRSRGRTLPKTRPPGLPSGVRNGGELEWDQLVRLAEGWRREHPERPSGRKVQEHYGLGRDNAKKLIARVWPEFGERPELHAIGGQDDTQATG